MFRANVLKFSQHAVLKNILISTNDATLVYALPDDRIYGIGYSKERALSAVPFWGANVYGKVLMDVRTFLQKSL